MTEKDILNFILKIEDKYPVDTWIIDDIHIWPIIRVRLGYSLYNRELNIIKCDSNDKKGKGKWNIFQTIKIMIKECFLTLKISILDIKHNNKKNDAKGLFLLDSINRNSLSIDDEWIEHCLDPFIMLFQKKNIKTYAEEELFFDRNINIPRATDSHLFNIILWYCKMQCKIKALLKNNYNVSLSDYNLFSQECNKKGIFVYREKDLIGMVRHIRQYEQYFVKLIKKRGIKAGFSSEWWSEKAMAMALACRKLRIESIEVQHGFYGGENWIYAKWMKVPYSGYEVMPTCYWCWSYEVASSINSGNLHEKTIVGGAPMHLYWQMIIDKNILEEMIADIRSNIPKGQKIILFSMQPYSINDYPKWFFPAIRELAMKYYIMIRKHPGDIELQDLLLKEFIGVPNVEWEIATKYPLELIALEVKVNITLNSSTIFDVLIGGVPSVFVDSLFLDRFKYEIEKGNVKYANTKKDFLRWVNYYLKKDKNNNWGVNSIQSQATKVLFDLL